MVKIKKGVFENPDDKKIKKPLGSLRQGSGQALLQDSGRVALGKENFDEFPVNEKQEVLQSPEKFAEKKEFTQDLIENKRLRAQIEQTDLDDSLKKQVLSHANDMQSLSTQETIKNLLHIAKDKGVVFAVAVAKKMNDPYILDKLHDILAKGGYYKSFLK